MSATRSGRRTASPVFFRWTEPDRPDIEDWKTKKFSYTYRGAASRKAFWVFELGSEYRPGTGIMKDRILIAFDFGVMGDTVIKNEANWIRFPSSAFIGETAHPLHVIVKDNEKGGYGIGATIRAHIDFLGARLATKQEIAKALGINIREVTGTQRW